MKISTIKKLTILVSVIAIVLSGCRLQVEDLLKAPTPTSDQLRILEEIKSEIGENVVLRYPLSGNRRAPIQMIDLDGDGMLEAVVFYTIQSESPLPNISVLKNNGVTGF